MNDLNHSDEKVLLERLRKGDEPAFMEIYHRYKKRLAGNLLKLLKSDELTDDMLQELFIKLWEHRANIDPEQPIKGYLFKVAENLVYDVFRRAARDKTMREYLRAVQPYTYNHIEHHISDKENMALLEKVISQMPPQRQKIFRLCKIEGKSHEEVSRILGISTSTINNQIVKASQFLANQLAIEKAMAISLLSAAILQGL